jgi:hypothetical protein
MSAPCSRALVTNPARSECPAKWIVAGGGSVPLHDLADRVIGQPFSADPIALPDGHEHGPAGDLRSSQPGVERFDWLEPSAARDRDLLTLGLLVGLRFPNMHDKAVGVPLNVGELKRGELGAAQRGGEADEKDRPVSPTDQSVGDLFKHGRDRPRRGRRLAHRRDADAAPDPAQHGVHRFRCRRRVEHLELVRIGDRGELPRDGRGFAAGVGELGEIGGDVAGARGQRVGSRAPAPDLEVSPIGAIGPAASSRFKVAPNAALRPDVTNVNGLVCGTFTAPFCNGTQKKVGGTVGAGNMAFPELLLPVEYARAARPVRDACGACP